MIFKLGIFTLERAILLVVNFIFKILLDFSILI